VLLLLFPQFLFPALAFHFAAGVWREVKAQRLEEEVGEESDKHQVA